MQQGGVLQLLKVSGRVCSKKARFWLHSKNFGLKQLCTTVKSFVTKVLKYKAVTICPLVMSPYSCYAILY